MGKLTMAAKPGKIEVNNSAAKSLGVSLGLEDIEKAEPFASLFDIRDETLEAIKADMKAQGFDPSKPVNVWRTAEGKRILIDGYTRVRAAEELGLLSITAYEKTFKDEAEALAYAIHTQKDRRNLTGAEILRLVEYIDKPIKGFKGSSPLAQSATNGEKPIKTAQITAEAVGTSTRTVEAVRTILADPEEAAAVRSGAKSINQAAKDARGKSSKPSAPRAVKPATRSLADMKTLRATIDRQIKQLEKQINTESARASAATKATGKQSRDYLTGHVEGLTEALALARRLYEQAKEGTTL